MTPARTVPRDAWLGQRPRAEKIARRRPHGPPAFTLIELMVVVGIIALVLTMGIPLVYRVTHKAPMRKAVTDLLELCSHARARAIFSGGMTSLVFNGGDGTMGISGGSGPATRPASSAEDQPAPPPGPASLSPGPTKLSERLPESVAIQKLYVSGIDCMDLEQTSVRFFPNGTCDELILQLYCADSNERVEISLEVTTGLAFVEWDWGKFRLK